MAKTTRARLLMTVATGVLAATAAAKLSATPPGGGAPQDFTAPVGGALKACLFGDPNTPGDTGVVGTFDKKHAEAAKGLLAAGQLTTASVQDLKNYEAASGKDLGKSKSAEGFQDEDSCCVVFLTGAGKDIGGSAAHKAALVAHEVDHSVEGRRWGKKGKGKKGLRKYVMCEFGGGSIGGAGIALGPVIWEPYVETGGHAAGLKAALGGNGAAAADKQNAAKAQAEGLAAALGDLCSKLKKAQNDNAVPKKAGDPMWTWYQDLLKCAKDGKKALDAYNQQANPADRRAPAGK